MPKKNRMNSVNTKSDGSCSGILVVIIILIIIVIIGGMMSRKKRFKCEYYKDQQLTTDQQCSTDKPCKSNTTNNCMKKLNDVCPGCTTDQAPGPTPGPAPGPTCDKSKIGPIKLPSQIQNLCPEKDRYVGDTQSSNGLNKIFSDGNEDGQEKWIKIFPALASQGSYSSCKNITGPGRTESAPGCYMFGGNGKYNDNAKGLKNFLNAANAFPQFCNNKDIDKNILELAAFLGNVSQETGEPGKSGLVYSAELGSSCNSLFGKGPVQLTGSNNYFNATLGVGSVGNPGVDKCANNVLNVSACGSSGSGGNTRACKKFTGKAIPGNIQNVTDKQCEPCATKGQKWWPCNKKGLCECSETYESFVSDSVSCDSFNLSNAFGCWQACASTTPKDPPEGCGYNLCKEPWLASSNVDAAWKSSLWYWMNSPIASNVFKQYNLKGNANCATAHNLLQGDYGCDDWCGVTAIAQIGCPSCCTGVVQGKLDPMTVNRIGNFVRIAQILGYSKTPQQDDNKTGKIFCKLLNTCKNMSGTTPDDTCPNGISWKDWKNGWDNTAL